ncbi:MAG: HlyD family efflux transporter periplasmic adaptor subunit [Bacteroidaceae bacterium]|jgi:multidrug efflux pump subunit AcrA (membrane-fusion protein)|nr:HlyD family efflux transporter periplasmic adaptor subunit [Bacteroidaceae bacterium]
MENDYNDIELRSDEVQEVMSAIPPVLLRYGIGILLAVVAVLLIGSMFFEMPDSVEATFTLTSDNPPAYIHASSSGILEQIEISNGEMVNEGSILAMLQNVGNAQDILILRNRLKKWQEKGGHIGYFDEVLLNKIPQLGDVQDAYSACQLTWSQYLQSPYGIEVNAKMQGAISALQTAMSKWEELSLLVSPIKGKVYFMQLWRPLQHVATGETVFVVIPDEQNNPIGKAMLPAEGIGKVSVGQRAIIRLSGFSEQEFGYIEGKVMSISPVPDADNKYVVGIEMPQGVTTSQHKTLAVQPVMTGSVEIVTRDRSLLRILLNI